MGRFNKIRRFSSGCDSVGQHPVKAMETPASVVMGATYPINTSYPNDKNFTIIDMG